MEKAETELHKLLAVDPNSPELLDNLGLAFHLQGKTDSAIETFERVLKIQRFPDAVAMLAVDYCRNHEFDRAAPLLQEAKAYFNNTDILVTVGPCLLEADRPEDAVIVYERLVAERVPPEDETTVNLVRAHVDLSRKLFTLLASVPGAGNYLQAIESAKKEGSLDAGSLFSKAYADAPYLKQEMSVQELIALLPVHPKDAALLYVLGEKCAQRAADEIDWIEDHWPDSVALSQLIAELKDAQGDRDGAIQVYEQALSKHPDAPDSLHFSLGLMYAERQRWRDALDQYRAVRPDSTGSLYFKQRVSEALVHLGQNQSVSNLLRPIVARPDAPFWALQDFGKAMEGLHQDQAAVLYLKRASAIKPSDASTHYYLARSYHKLNDAKSAAAEVMTYKQLSGRMPGTEH